MDNEIIRSGAEAPVLASFSLTHIHYDPTDPLSYLSAILSLLPHILLVSYTILSLSSREAELLLCFSGQLASEVLNALLKRHFRENRPDLIHNLGGHGYGMPSSHAQFMGFWAVYVCLFLLVRFRGGQDQLGRIQKAGMAAAVVGVAVCVAVSRVYLSYHTVKQVGAGWAIGMVCGGAWFWVVWMLRSSGLLGWVLELEVVRWFRVRDLLVEEDLAEAGWREWESRRMRRREGKERMEEPGKGVRGNGRAHIHQD